MTEHFNKLTPAEDERLAMLAEECAEVIQIVSKIQRHGYDSWHPDDPLKTHGERSCSTPIIRKTPNDRHSETDDHLTTNP